MLTRTALACLAAAGLGLAAQAETIHVAFDAAPGDSFATVDTLLDGVVVSTGTNGTDTWNLGNFNGPAGADSIADLLLTDGNSSGASLAATYQNASNLGGAFDIVGKPNANDDYALMDGTLVMNNTTSVTVTGLSSAFTDNGYTVTVYTTHADTRTATFTIVDPITGTSTAMTQQPSAATFDGDFTGFSAELTGLASGSFVLTGTSNQNAAGVHNLAGISITAIPEPGSLALLGLGGLLIARRRRP